jgi:hypothetical protein
MSLKELIHVLSECGLKRTYAKVFVFLAIEGPKEINFLAKALRMPKTELVNCLEHLVQQGMVKRIDEIFPEQFFAIPFEKGLDVLIEANLKEATFAEKNKEAILRYWDSVFKES